MVFPAPPGTAIFERGSRGRDRTADHRVKACCRNRLATRLCVAVSSGWSRLCLPCRIWQTHRRYSALSTRGFLCACTTSWTRAPLRIHPSKQRLFTSIWRTGWDSNPRMLSHRRFSRPLPSSSRQPVLWGLHTGSPLGGIEPLSPLASRGLLPFMLHSLADYLRQSLKLGVI